MTSSPAPELAVLVPTLDRPDSLAPLAEAFAAATDADYRIVFIADSDDDATWLALADLIADRPECIALEADGTYPVKVNAGIRATETPLFLPGADDIRPHPGWLEAAKAKMEPGIGFVSLNDLGNPAVLRGEYATLPLVARWYADQFDQFYCEDFHHNMVDVDASVTAKARGAFAYAPDAVMEHLHPTWGKGTIDATYRRGGLNAGKVSADEQVFRERHPTVKWP